MLRETAEELGLVEYVDEFKQPERHIDPSFYEDLRGDDDPPIFIEVLNALFGENENIGN